MASDPQFPLVLLLLGGCCSASLGSSSHCNLTCSTDYQASINCSCSGTVPPLPVRVQVSCSGEDLNVSENCSISPPIPWCQMLMEDLWLIASVGTLCTSAMVQQGGTTETSSWALADVVKPSAPFNVQVTETDEFFNITWRVHNDRRLLYKVCVQDSNHLLQDGPHCFELEDQTVLLDRRRLQSATGLVVHVQARVYPRYLQGPWSEWSGPAAWRPSGMSAAKDGVGAAWLLVSLPVVLVFVLGLVLLAFLHKPFWQKKLDFVTFVPKPNHFFEPLYQTYQGNFKDWVSSAFNEYDYIHVRPNTEETTSMKRFDVLLWNDECSSLQRPLQDEDVNRCGCLLQCPLQVESGRFQRTTPSIHTVTLSGEEGGDQRGAATASAPHGDRDGSEENYPFPLLVDVAEKASLVSLASMSRHSEDGYTHMDLDTIDSGFGECGSPGANQAEQQVFGEHRPSNYVKQWMVSSEGEGNGCKETLTLPDSGC